MALCEGNPPVISGFPAQRPVMRSFDVFFAVHQNKRLSEQSKPRWFATQLRSLWHHCNGLGESLSTLNHGYAIMVMHYGLTRGVGIYAYFQNHRPSPCAAQTVDKCLLIGLCNVDCETVYLHCMPPEVVTHWRRTSGWCQLGLQRSCTYRMKYTHREWQ